MGEYIDRKAVLDELDEDIEEFVECDYALKTAKKYIKKNPPADVRPVVRGRWVKVGGFVTPGGDPVWECSECGKGRHVYGIEHGTYGADVSDGQWVACPNCMAIMEESE